MREINKSNVVELVRSVGFCMDADIAVQVILALNEHITGTHCVSSPHGPEWAARVFNSEDRYEVGQIARWPEDIIEMERIKVSNYAADAAVNILRICLWAIRGSTEDQVDAHLRQIALAAIFPLTVIPTVGQRALLEPSAQVLWDMVLEERGRRTTPEPQSVPLKDLVQAYERRGTLVWADPAQRALAERIPFYPNARSVLCG